MGSRIPNGFFNFVVHLMSNGDPDVDACQFGIRSSIPFVDVTPILVTTFGDALADLLMSQVSTSTSVIGYRVEGPNFSGASATLDVGSTTVGVSGNPMAPQNTAYLVHKGTGFGGRQNRGRNYIPGVPENLVSDSGLISGANVTAFNNLAITFTGDIASGDFLLVDSIVILHTAGGPFDAATPPDVNVITLDPLAATQRRRMRH